jgi:hypothetical protein
MSEGSACVEFVMDITDQKSAAQALRGRKVQALS